MRSPARIAAVLSLTILTAAPAAATHGGIHPTFRKESVYFHCAGPTKVSNVNNAAADGAPATWNTTPPSQSATAGAGCGAIDVGAVRATGQVDAIFKGTFTGNLRDLTVNLHSLLLSRARTSANMTVKVQWLEIDGAAVIENTPLEVTPVVSSTGASELVSFSITGLGAANATEDGDGTTVREIMLMIDTDPNQANTIWVWDATEVPSGIEFNPDTLAAAKLRAAN